MVMNVPTPTKAARPMEKYQQKLDLLGFEVDDPHCPSARQLLCPATQRDIAVERKAVSSLASAPWLIFLWRGL
jgi:hypothetical protein